MEKSKKKSKSENLLKNNIILILCNTVVHILFLLASTFAALIFAAERKTAFVFCLIAFCAANVVTGAVSARKKGRKGLLNGVLLSLPSNVLILIISLLMNGFEVDFNIIITILAVLLSSSTGGVISVNKKKNLKIKAGQGKRK